MRFLRPSARGDRIETPGTYELLAALQHDFELYEQGLELEDPKRQRATAAMFGAFLKADLLVACEQGVISGTPDIEQGTIVAATDTEAAEAYIAGLGDVPRARAIAFLPLSQATDEKPSQAVWLGAMHRHGADHVVVNPAGPAGSAIFHLTPVRDIAPHVQRIRPPHIDPKWLEPAYRAGRRSLIAATLSRCAGIARGGDPGGHAQIRAAAGDVESFNSPLAKASLGYLEGLARLRAGEQLSEGLRLAVMSALDGARDGFPEHCVDALLEIAPTLLSAALDSNVELDPAIMALTTSKNALQGMHHVGLSWRADEVDRFIAEAARTLAAATAGER